MMDEKVHAPERIYVSPAWANTFTAQSDPIEAEYIRADLAPPAPATALVERLIGDLERAQIRFDLLSRGSGEPTVKLDVAITELSAALTAARAWRDGQPVAGVAGEPLHIPFPEGWRERNGGMNFKAQKIWADGFNACRDAALCALSEDGK